MMRTLAFAVVVVGMVFSSQVATAQFGGAGAPQFGGGEFGGGGGIGFQAHQAEPPNSVFNEVIRRYRFDLGPAPVTADTVEEFNVYFDEHSDDKIIGAYADGETNMLVVVAPPNAELAVRFSLARLFVNRQADPSQTLMFQQRSLDHRRRELLLEMASVEIQQVGAKEADENKLNERIESLEEELSVVEKQLQVVVKYNERMAKAVAGEASVADDTNPFAN